VPLRSLLDVSFDYRAAMDNPRNIENHYWLDRVISAPYNGKPVGRHVFYQSSLTKTLRQGVDVIVKMINRTCHCTFYAIFIVTIYVFNSTPLQAANLILSTNTTSDSEVLILQIDKVEKLAGMKLTLDYPARFLEYKSAQKASAFNAFMQVINDKKPGRLIIVMASATGVSGENLKIFELTFSKSAQDLPPTLKIAPAECQLMSESLQEIPCKTSPLSISIPQ
jgi:hypothetical protein